MPPDRRQLRIGFFVVFVGLVLSYIVAGFVFPYPAPICNTAVCNASSASGLAGLGLVIVGMMFLGTALYREDAPAPPPGPPVPQYSFAPIPNAGPAPPTPAAPPNAPSDSNRRCPGCGASVTAAYGFCPRCGRTLPP